MRRAMGGSISEVSPVLGIEEPGDGGAGRSWPAAVPAAAGGVDGGRGEARIRELLQAYSTIPATVIAERIGPCATPAPAVTTLGGLARPDTRPVTHMAAQRGEWWRIPAPRARTRNRRFGMPPHVGRGVRRRDGAGLGLLLVKDPLSGSQANGPLNRVLSVPYCGVTRNARKP